jgi:hypothetical protein
MFAYFPSSPSNSELPEKGSCMWFAPDCVCNTEYYLTYNGAQYFYVEGTFL